MLYENEQQKIDVLVRFPAQVFPDKFADWGEKQRGLMVIPHALGIVFSVFAAIAALFVELPLSKQEQNGASTKTIVTPGSSQAERYLDMKPRPIGQ